jgi:hypothetical protein
MPQLINKSDWDELKNSLFIQSETFALNVEAMTDEKLDSNFVEEKYGTYNRNIEAMIEHSYYHLGQVSLIKKMVKSKT